MPADTDMDQIQIDVRSGEGVGSGVALLSEDEQALANMSSKVQLSLIIFYIK